MESEKISGGKKVEDLFEYTSDKNKDWMKIENLTNWIEQKKNLIGTF